MKLTVKEWNKLNSKRCCFVLLSAPLSCTQLLPGEKNKTYTHTYIIVFIIFVILQVQHCRFPYMPILVNKSWKVIFVKKNTFLPPSCVLLPAGSMPPVAVRVIEALTESQSMTNELLCLALVCHLLLLCFALQL